MLPVFSIGPLSIRLPELFLLFGFWIGLEQARKYAPKQRLNPNDLFNLVMVSLIAGIAGARLSYAFTHLSAFAGRPLGIFAISLDMLDLSGGLLFAGLAALIYGKMLGMGFWPVLDVLTVGLAVLAVTLGLSHFSSGDAFGAPTSLPWGIELWGARRHPTQIYETLLAWLVALAVWPRANDLVARFFHSAPGSRFWLFLAGSAAARLFVEGFRGDSPLLLERIRQPQIAAWIILAVALWQLARRLPQQPPKPKPIPPEDLPHASPFIQGD